MLPKLLRHLAGAFRHSAVETKRIVIATCESGGVVLFTRLRMRPAQFRRMRSQVVLRCPACRAPHVFDRSDLRLSEE